MQKFAARISYVGTDYCGWQSQGAPTPDGKISIQETFKSALTRITEEDRVSPVGSGRTDAGVHAMGQVVHWVLEKKEWEPEILKRALNSLLPASIRAIEVRKVPLEFHAQRSAEKKQYSYFFQQGPCALPSQEPFSWWIQKRLDERAMQEALNALIGEHDFKPFQASGAKPGPTVRQIFEAEVTRIPVPLPDRAPSDPPFEFVRVRVMGSGFLKQMVRGICGTLLQVGESRRDSGCMAEILRTQDRSLVGPTAPARALWLERVWYPENPI